MDSWGVGIIGYGFIGKVHAYAYATLPFYYDPPPLRARLVGVATARRETAEKARSQAGFQSAAADWRELVDDPDIRIIHICSPNNAHREQLLAAMAAGKHIYCEKPLVSDMGEAREVETALLSYRGTAQMVFHNRFFPAMMRARQLAAQGFLGEVTSFRAAYLHSGAIDPDRPAGWRHVRGGGVLRDLGSHLLDAVTWIVGPFQSVSAARRVLHPARPGAAGGTVAVEMEDQVVITARLASGALGTLEASKTATGTDDELRLEVHGTRGAIRFSLADLNTLEIFDRAAPERPLGGTTGWKRIPVNQRFEAPAVFPPPRTTGDWLRGHVHCLHSFLSAVAEGRPADPDIRRGIEVQRMMEAVERSADTGAWVDL
jgi:predicted dehydrogenase